MSKPLLLWSHPRSASSQYLEEYCRHKNILCDKTEPLQHDTSQLHHLITNKVSFKVMPCYLKYDTRDTLLDLDYEHVFLFRKDIYRQYLSFCFAQSTNIFHSSHIKGKINITTKHHADLNIIRNFYYSLDQAYKKCKNTRLIETGDAIRFLGDIGFQGTDEYYKHFDNINVKHELEKFVRTLEMYKNYDLQSTI